MATIYAITPRGIGKRPGVRAIKETWSLEEGETFSVKDPPTRAHVLTDNGLALREMTAKEIALEESDQVDKEEEIIEGRELFKAAMLDPLVIALRRATPSTIDNFVSTHFNTFPQSFTVGQQEVIKLLLRTAILTLRKMK